MSNAVRKAPPLMMSLEEFLNWPGDGSAKHHELIDGVVRAMSPASATHGIIQNNLGYLIKKRLSETRAPCRVVTEPAIVPRLRANKNLRVPDLGVTCSSVQSGQITLPEPVLLVEVLSPSNAASTRQNVWTYATIPSLREILIVHSTRVGAELIRRNDDGSWPEEPAEIHPGEALRLDSVDLTCPLAEVYEGTHLA